RQHEQRDRQERLESTLKGIDSGAPTATRRRSRRHSDLRGTGRDSYAHDASIFRAPAMSWSMTVSSSASGSDTANPSTARVAAISPFRAITGTAITFSAPLAYE